MFAMPSLAPLAAGIKSVQSGTVTMSSINLTVKISNVAVAKSFVLVAASAGSSNQLAKARLTAVDTLSLVSDATGGVVDWQVVEFN